MRLTLKEKPVSLCQRANMKIENENKAKICLFLATIPLAIWFTYYVWNKELPAQQHSSIEYSPPPPPTMTEKVGEAAGNTTRRFVKGMFRGIFYNDR